MNPFYSQKRGCGGHFSAIGRCFGQGNTFLAFFAYFAPISQNGLFSPNLNSKYLSELIPYRNDQGMENPLNFSYFPKMLPKRAFRTQNTPKTTNDKPQICKILDLSFVVLGAFWVRKALFGNIFGKFEKFKRFFIP